MWGLSSERPGAPVDADPQVPAGSTEVAGDEHRPVVDDDGVRHDDRPGRRVPQPLVDAQQPVVRQGRVRHRQAGLADPGRIGSGVSARASSTLASTDRVEGRSTAAVTVRVATSIIPVSSTRPGTPSSSSTSTSSGVESISISSPGAAGQAWREHPSGRPARPRRVAADPVVCLPADSRENNRNIVARDGSVPCLARARPAAARCATR